MTMTEAMNGQAHVQQAVSPAANVLAENVAKNLALQLAQVTLDKAFVEARLQLLLEHVQMLVQTTQWVQSDDDGTVTPVVATGPMQALQGLVLGQG
jgi:hypothetical protein